MMSAYGTERSYNTLRQAKSLMKHKPDELTLFLMADAVTCARAGQNPPAGYYNIELMLKAVSRHQNSRILLCGTCMDACRQTESELIEGIQRSDMETHFCNTTSWCGYRSIHEKDSDREHLI